jgi:hypothetical protein
MTDIVSIITTLGLEYQARYTGQSLAGVWGWMAPGTGTTTPTSADTALVAECTGTGMARKVATVTYEGSDITMFTATWTNNTAAPIVVGEIGIFNQLATGGVLFARGIFLAPKTVAVGQSITLRFPIKQAV